jgi:hypothetical protein
MPTIKRIQLLRATSAVRKANTLKVGELLTDLDTKRIATNDAVQAGGFPHALLRETNLTFANIAAVEAMDHGDYTNGQSVTVAGYYSPGDGGGGLFEWRSGSTSTPDGGSVFKPTSVGSGNGRFHRVLQASEFPSPEMFGGLGDGVLTANVVDGATYYHVSGQNVRPLVEACLLAYGRIEFSEAVYCFDRVVDLGFLHSGRALIRCEGPGTTLALLDATLIPSGSTPSSGQVVLPQWASGNWAHDTLFQCNPGYAFLTPDFWQFHGNGARVYLNQYHRPTNQTGYVRLPSRFIELAGYGHHVDNWRLEGFGVARGSVAGMPETFLIALALSNVAPVDPPHATNNSSFTCPTVNTTDQVTLTMTLLNGMSFTSGSWYFCQDRGWFQCVGVSGSNITFEHRYFYSTHGLYDSGGDTIPSGCAWIRPAFDDGRDFTYYPGPRVERVHFNGPVASQAVGDGFPVGATAELSLIMIAGSFTRLFEKPVIKDCHALNLDYANGAYLNTRPVQGFTNVNNRGGLIEDCSATNVGGSLVTIDAWICLDFCIRNCRVENSFGLFALDMGAYGWDYVRGALKFGPWWQMRVENCLGNTGNPTGAPNYRGTRLRTNSLDGGAVVRNPRYGQRAVCDWFQMRGCSLFNRPVRQESYVTALIFGGTGGGAEQGDVVVEDNVIHSDRNGSVWWPEQVVGTENVGLTNALRLVWRRNTDTLGRQVPIFQLYPELRQGHVWGQMEILDPQPYTIAETPDANSRLWLMDYAGYPWALLPWRSSFMWTGSSVTIVLPRVAKFGEGIPGGDPMYYGGIRNRWLPCDTIVGAGYDQPTRFYAPAGQSITIVNAGSGTVTVVCRKPSDPENLAALVTIGMISAGAVGRFAGYRGANDTYYV